MELMRKLTKWVLQYRYVVLVLVVGLILILLPMGEKKDEDTKIVAVTDAEPDVAAQLSQILCQIKGAGKVSVMLTLETSKTTVYQNDEDITGGENGSIRQDTVIVTDENRIQSGLIQHEIAPSYRGAIIVCEGADKPEVRLHIIEAVARVTGLGTDKISVLKMK